MLLLGTIVVEQAEGIFAQTDDGNEVAGSKAGHADITDVPYNIKAGDGPEEYHDAGREHTIDVQGILLGSEEPYVGFAIIVVADDAAEGKEEYGNGNEHWASRANLVLQRHLCQGNAVEATALVVATEQDNESGTAAYQQGVGKHT